MRKGVSVCGLNGFHSRNEMTNLSEREPPFPVGQTSAGSGSLPAEQMGLSLLKKGAHVYQRSKRNVSGL